MTAAAPRTPRTHAEASRESRDLVSGEVRPRETMIRFVAGPDGWVIPDLAGRLPGRGLWTGEELSLALGGENVIHSAFLAGRGSDRWTWDVQRLSGFRPLVPDSWIEATPPT